MVFFFEPRHYDAATQGWLIYMGRDKFENEDLIKYGLPYDVWFHVDNLSSAHVYLRLPKEGSIDDIPAETLEDCVQLVKANSIQGHKMNNIDVVYTMWSNLKKSPSMEVGQVKPINDNPGAPNRVGFHSNKAVKKVAVPTRINDIVNRLNRSKREAFPDLAAEREAHEREARSRKKAEVQEQARQEKAQRAEHKQQQELKSYKALMHDENMVSSKELASKYESAQDYEDDFM